VILELQLSFAVIPLVIFTGSRKKNGRVCQRPLAAGLAWEVTTKCKRIKPGTSWIFAFVNFG
jgi:Mn2+/Fe2+ NRAMP family transporter